MPADKELKDFLSQYSGKYRHELCRALMFGYKNGAEFLLGASYKSYDELVNDDKVPGMDSITRSERMALIDKLKKYRRELNLKHRN